jgi:hypothetical protein
MVTIINGEIVPDHDPRAKAYRERRNNTSRAQTNARTSNENTSRTTHQFQDGGQNNANSPFTEINNYLLRVGIPRFTLAGNVVEPIFLIAALVMVIFVGLPGLVLMAIVYFVYTSSLRNAGPNQRQGVM